MKNIFEFATRYKVRFNYKGIISVEDLWDLKVESLDEIYRSLRTEQKKAQEESLLATKTKTQELVDIKIAIIEHVVAIKLAEAEARVTAKENKEKKQMLLEILAQKENENLKNKSVEELKDMINKL